MGAFSLEERIEGQTLWLRKGTKSMGVPTRLVLAMRSTICMGCSGAPLARNPLVRPLSASGGAIAILKEREERVSFKSTGREGFVNGGQK